LLISTLHANDAVGAIARLNDLGIDSFKIGGALLGAVAQRLVRAICPHCKEPAQPNPALLQSLTHGAGVPSTVTFYEGRGCKKCLGTGYSGRMPIVEVMLMTSAMVHAIERGEPASKLKEIALIEGMVELSSAGLEQAIAGKTTVEEVYYETAG
jgi:type IV pilus assembly protein PilB